MRVGYVANGTIGEVKSRAYPAPEHTYPIAAEEYVQFETLVASKQS